MEPLTPRHIDLLFNYLLSELKYDSRSMKSIININNGANKYSFGIPVMYVAMICREYKYER